MYTDTSVMLSFLFLAEGVLILVYTIYLDSFTEFRLHRSLTIKGLSFVLISRDNSTEMESGKIINLLKLLSEMMMCDKSIGFDMKNGRVFGRHSLAIVLIENSHRSNSVIAFRAIRKKCSCVWDNIP